MNENPDLVRDCLSKEMKCGGILGPFIIPSTVFFSAYVLLVFYLNSERWILKLWKYVIIDKAILFIEKLGQGCCLSNIDNEKAFKLILVSRL